ncbi:MAG: hypothetical protein ACOY15_11390 [Pseudomonadota bacterium]
MAAILAFRHPHKDQNWTNEELAELFRVVDILSRAGVAIDTDMGLSDEGEPWFAFCRADTGDVIVHFSRIDGQFVAVSAATDAVMRGNNFRRVAEALVNRQPLILPAPSSGQKLFLHPSVILTALVATTLAQMKSWEGQDITAIDDVTDAVVHTVSEATFSETLKTAFMDALNLVLRGFTGPIDTKASAEYAQSTALGLGLGNLSLASVVAFAISVIQGSWLQDEVDIASRASLPADSSDAAVKKSAGPVGAPQVAENKVQADAGAVDRVAESREPAPVKIAPRDAAVSGAMEKSGPVEKSGGVAASDESSAYAVQRESADKIILADTGSGILQAKPEAPEAKADAPKAEPARQQPVEQKEVVFQVAELKASGEYHRISFTEISKEAIEIFFGKSTEIPASGVTFRIGDISGGKNELSSVAGAMASLSDGQVGFPSSTVRQALNASDIVFAGGDPVALARLNLITDFVNSTDSKFSVPASFPELLKQYWAGDKALTVVVFDSDDLPLDIFSFTNNVLFVEESQLNGVAMNAGDSALQVDLANGGDVMLLGVINLNPHMTA